MIRSLSALATVLLLGLVSPHVSQGDELRKQFLTPPDSARPHAWWHWMNGNITREGLESDLRWMKEAGLGGAFAIEAGLSTPLLVDDRLVYMSPAWRDAFRHAATVADQLDLDFGIFSSPGWSLTGGPWVAPEQAMKKLVWSRTRVAGGRLFDERLPELPLETGPFQDMPGGHGWLVGEGETTEIPRFHADSAVIAYPVPREWRDYRNALPRVTASAGHLDARAVIDGDTATAVALPATSSNGAAWVMLRYDEPVEVRSVTAAVRPAGSKVKLTWSNDGKTFHRGKTLRVGSAAQLTVTTREMRARWFRFEITPPLRRLPTWGKPAPGVSTDRLAELTGLQKPEPDIVVHDLVLHGMDRVHHFEKKAGFALTGNYAGIPPPPQRQQQNPQPQEVIDLTGNMVTDGTLRWQVPPGDWVVLRLGYSLVGSMNHAAPAEATGLEVDKLSKLHAQRYVQDYLGQYAETLETEHLASAGIVGLMSDSFETGSQNWTEDILTQFESLRGYDPRPWLPALTGVIIGNSEDSDRFLWDFRRTLGELLVTEHYASLANAAAEHRLRLYSEAMEYFRLMPGDDMAMRRYADVPTGAMWMFDPDSGPDPRHIADLRGAASIAHIHGRKRVAAEMFTTGLTPWAHAPRHLKPVADQAFALGVNLPIIHTSVHQPLDDRRPGLSLSVFGQYLNRHETWAGLAKPWMDYLSRSAYLLQQGRHVADIAYFYGEERPLITLDHKPLPPGVPPGYGFDYVNGDTLLRHLSVADGKLVTPSGASYTLLYLGPESARMTLPLLRRLRDLVAAGARVAGTRPSRSPALSDDPAEFERIVVELWGEDPDTAKRTRLGEGEVFSGVDTAAILRRLGVPEDLGTRGVASAASIAFQHRHSPDGEIYFVANATNTPRRFEAAFRVTGRSPELWHADTGRTELADFRVEHGQTVIAMDLEPWESAFVVFRERTTEKMRRSEPPRWKTLAALDGSWRLSYPAATDNSRTLQLETLTSWSERPEPGLKYFSGTAAYFRTLDVREEWIASGARLLLDLGKVRELAQVLVNSKPVCIAWKPPFRCDVTNTLLPGSNRLEVRVTNLWINRLIGDQQPGQRPTSFTTAPPYRADAPLRESGLLGPVTLLRRD